MPDWKSNLDLVPVLAPNVYVAKSALVVGRVEIGERSSVWPGVSARGDVNWIRIGAGSNVQDNSVLHVDKHPVEIGDDVTVGHACVLHGCTVKDRCLIGMGSVVLDGAVIGPDALVGAGSVVKQNQVVPPGTLFLGVPAQRIRSLAPEELAALVESARSYSEFALEYLRRSI